MIQKLESAGLGYHVKADETTEKLGKNRIKRFPSIHGAGKLSQKTHFTTPSPCCTFMKVINDL